MQEVSIAPLSPDRLAALIGPDRWEVLRAAAEQTRDRLGDRKVWNVNATAQGGGVAEMLQTLLAYSRGMGVNTRWLVLEGDPEFFTTTKRIHNAIHGSAGDGGDLGDREHANYEQVLARNLDAMADRVGPGDIVLLHDPQTAGLIEGVRGLGGRVVWRSHIGRDEPNEHTDRAWRFLARYLEHAEAVVVSRPSYAPPGVPAEKMVVIPPSIDPFATKNDMIEDHQVRGVLARVGVLEGTDPGACLTFTRRDGGPGTVRRHQDLLVEGTVLPRDARLVLQVSRWDRLKDMPGVMTAFTDHLDADDDVHLMLAGPAVDGVSDDPEGAEVLEQCRALWRDLSPERQRRVHLVCVPMDDIDENAHVINALQRYASVVVQKSLFEGFGLTVTEAMWKNRPVIASAIGGIQDQIFDGRDGLLLPDPTDLGQLGSALARVLDDDTLAKMLGDSAHRRVHNDFLGDRHLLQYAALFAALE